MRRHPAIEFTQVYAHGDIYSVWSDEARRRFMARVEVSSDGHWLWCGTVAQNGYGRVRTRIGDFTCSQAAHRVALEMVGVPCHECDHVDHLCRIRRCVNPTHLERVSAQENRHRARSNRGVPVGAHSWSPIGRDLTPLLGAA